MIYESQDFDKLRYTLDPNRDRKTYHFKKGHTIGGRNSWSEEAKARASVKQRESCFKRISEGTFGGAAFAHLLMKPVRCLTNGKEYKSVKDAAEDNGIKPNQISASITRNGTVHGMKFERITV